MKKFSKRFQLNAQNFLHGLYMAISGSLLSILYTSFEAGDFTVTWDSLWKGALLASVAYLQKKFVESVPKQVEIDPTKTDVIHKE